jgi:hypothetical protein
MILHGDDKLEIGKRYLDEVSGPDMEYHLIGYVVLREATLKELKEFIASHSTKDTGYYGKYIYEVSMD